MCQIKQRMVPGDRKVSMNNYDIKCRIIEEELKTFWPQWHVIRCLGGGAFGDVFEIYRDNFGIREKSALKMIQIRDVTETAYLITPTGEAESRSQDGQAAIPKAFRNEIQIMEALRGAPNIVTIEDFYLKREESSTMLFVRMELLTSFQQILAERQRDQQPFTIPEILKIGRDICTALMYCETKKIIHRDIKPANLFLDVFGNYKVGDFGVSRHMDTVHRALTMTGIGTISYMAPEVFKGQLYNNTVDIYALGLILYQLLNNNRIPFLPTEGSYTTKDIDSANYKRLHGESLPSLTGIRIGNETVDASLDAMIRKACAIRSEDRYQSAKAFCEDLAAWGATQSKRPQEGISQDRLQEKKPQIISRQRLSSLSEKQSQDENLAWEQTTPFPFIGNTQDEYTDPTRDMHRNPQAELTPESDTTGMRYAYSPEVKADKKAGWKRQNNGRSRIAVYASVLVLVGLTVCIGYFITHRLQQSLVSSSSSASPVSADVEENGGDSEKDDSAEMIEIPDPVLRKAIQEALGLGNREITKKDALLLKRLDYDGEDRDQIKNIDGLSAFKNLTELYLTRNQISDISALSGLTNLKILYLRNNQVSDISALSGLTNLTELYLTQNQVSDISALSGLTNLTELGLGQNQVSGISALSDLTNLTYLGLTQNQVSDISTLSGLTNLTELYLTRNQVSDISALSGLTNLTELYLTRNQVSDISALSGLTKLTELGLRENQVSDISALSGLTNLTELYLTENQVSDISALSGLTKLTELGLSKNRISDISALSGLTNLTYLGLVQNQISDISALSGLTNLTELHLAGNPILEQKSRDEIMEVLSGADQLEHVDF